MAATAGVVIGWTRPFPGHEGETLSKFNEYVGYLGTLQSNGQIESFEPVFTVPHGGDLNGFFLIRGDTTKLAKVKDSDDWKNWVTWGSFHLAGFGVADCHLGNAIKEEMGRFSKFVKR